jgi:hypothetical protein
MTILVTKDPITKLLKKINNGMSIPSMKSFMEPPKK